MTTAICCGPPYGCQKKILLHAGGRAFRSKFCPGDTFRPGITCAATRACWGWTRNGLKVLEYEMAIYVWRCGRERSVSAIDKLSPPNKTRATCW